MLENMKVVRDKEGDHNHKSEHVGFLTKISKKRKSRKGETGHPRHAYLYYEATFYLRPKKHKVNMGEGSC